ncbi:MAG: hypothetical protein ACLGGX_09320 [Bdellovibrionia bacterium]
MKFKLIAFILMILGSLRSHAHPVAFEGAVAVLGDSSPEILSQQVLYSYKYWGALGVHSLRISENAKPTDFLIVKNNFLLKRWHQPDSQGNVYLGFGYGQEKKADHQRPVAEVDVQADWESRRFYTMALFQKMYRDKEHSLFEYQMQRVGVAPYYGDFEDLSIWLIAERTQVLYQTETWATLLRFYFKNVLWEIGATNQGGGIFNYMVHF